MILGRRSPFTWLLVLLTVIFFFVISRSDKSSSGNVAYKPRRAASTNQRAYRTSSPQAREQQPPTANSNEHGADAYDWLEQRERAARVVDAAVEEGRRKAQANVRVGAPAFPERGRGKPEREGCVKLLLPRSSSPLTGECTGGEIMSRLSLGATAKTRTSCTTSNCKSSALQRAMCPATMTKRWTRTWMRRDDG